MNPEHRTANNTAEQSIDRVLGALRDATPSAGMEQRVLRTLEAHSSSVPSRPSPMLSFRAKAQRAEAEEPGSPANLFAGVEEPPHFAYAATALRWTAATALAALTIAALITYNTHRPTTHGSVAPTPAPAPQASIITATPEPIPVHYTKASVSPATPRLPEAPTTGYTAEISHPAPPIPLTEQEKLLLHYAQHGHTSDLAQISNEKTTAKEEQEKAEFVAFFTPPPPPPMTGESE